LDKEVNEVCEIMNDYKITEERDMPQEVWDRFKKQGTETNDVKKDNIKSTVY
jgi:hypothetical protein